MSVDERVRRLLVPLALVALAGCVSVPVPPTSPLLLPTRALRGPTPAPTPDARTHYEAGLACQSAGDSECALQSLTQAIQIDPSFVPAYLARGAVYLTLGELDEALSDADAALEIDHVSASAYALRGELLRLLDQPRRALEDFDRAVSYDPTLEEALFRSRWLAALAAEDADRLVKLSRDYADAHPQDPLLYYYRGWAFVERGNPEIAIDLLIYGIQETSAPPALLWFALGCAYLEGNFWQEAVTSLEIARELVEAGDASLSFHSDRPIADLFGALGRAYLGVGRCADAQAMLEYAIAVGAPASDYRTALTEARRCQTPTPAPTPDATTTPSP
jgi:tetratricopeptide (TPR) repeat protein